MCAPAPAVFGSAPARGPLSMQKNALSPATPFHRERETRLSPTAPSRRSAPGSGTQADLPGENCQTAVDGRGCQGANAFGDREFAHSQQPYPAGKLPAMGQHPAGKFPAAGHGPILPGAKPPNGGWQRAVSKCKRRQVPGNRSLLNSPPRRGAPSSETRPGFAKGKIAKRWLAKGGVKVQTPPGTGKPLAPDNTASPGNFQRRNNARFCRGQNRQMVAGEGGRQSANAAGYREAARSRQHCLTGELPAAGHGLVLPKAKSPNGVWRRAVSKLKRFQRLSGARAPCSRRGGPGRWTAPAGRSRPPPPGRPGGG